MSKSARSIVILLFIAGAVAFYLGHRRNSKSGVEIGEDAPDFNLPGLTERSLALANYKQKVVVVNFWATWCPPCVQETPSLEKFAAKVQPMGVAVIGVSVDQDRTALEKFVSDYHMAYPIALDPDRTLAARYGTFQFPETYIIDRHGRVAEKIIGAIDWQDPRILSFVETLTPKPGNRAE